MDRKRVIGISVYPEKVGKDETIQYINDAYESGFRRIFANLLQVEPNEEGMAQVKMQTEVFKHARDLGYEIILDVNPGVYEAFSLKPTELKFFKDMNVTGIRLDLDFKGEVESQLSNNKEGMMIELNASSGTETIDKTVELGANVNQLMACHNFYPMEYTGLSYSAFVKLSNHFYNLGMRVGAFVTLPKEQNGVGPWEDNDGMPTIEDHRWIPIDDQIRHFLAMGFITDIIVSQHKANKQQLDLVKKITDANKDVIFKIDWDKNITKEEQMVIDYDHFNRPDVNDFFIRSTMTRVIYKDLEIKPRLHKNDYYEVGDVYVNNDKFGRYKGELHIVTKRMPNDGRRNFIGKIIEFDHKLLEFVGPGKTFTFIGKGDK